MRMGNVQSRSGFNPITAKKLFYSDFHPLKASGNYSDLTNGSQDFVKHCCPMLRFIFSMFNVLIQMKKNEHNRDRRLKG